MTLTLVERIREILPTNQQHLAQEILDCVKPYWLERVGKLTNDRQQLQHQVQLLKEIIVELEVAKKLACKTTSSCGIIN